MKFYSAPVEEKELCFYGTEHQVQGIKPHPDGQPRTKCCTNVPCCAYLRVNGKSRAQNSNGLKAGKLRFFCTHRLADGFHRICAGWHAVQQGRKLKETK